MIKQKLNFREGTFDGLADSLSLQSLSSPIIPSNSCSFSKAASCTTFMSYVVCTSAAAPAHDVDSLALALTH